MSRRTWIVVLIIIGALGAIPLGFVLTIGYLTRSREAAGDALIAAFIDEAGTRPRGRPVLRGEAVPGNAWDDYSEAIREAAKIGDDDAARLRDHWNEESKLDRATIEGILARAPEAFARLRAGTRKADGAYPYDWARRLDITGPDMPRELVYLVIVRSDLLREDARPVEAAELLLDLVQMGPDFAHNATGWGEQMGHFAMGSSLEDLRDLLASHSLSREGCAQVARELAILDAGYPDAAHTILNGAIPYEPREIKDKSARRAKWRFGGSVPLMRASGRLFTLRAYRRTADLAALPWPNVLAKLERMETEKKATKNPYARMPDPTWLVASRTIRARVRLLRIAAHWYATGEVLALDDPFGTTIRHEKSPPGIRVWSAFEDDLDDGGLGDWDSPEKRDLVLELTPRPQ